MKQLTTDSYKHIGARIKLARIDAGLTQTELADKLGVTSVMISRYESGKTSPMRQLGEIADILGKKTEYFFGDDEKNDLYEDIKELVKLLKERVNDDSWPFKPSVPLLSYEDVQKLQAKGIGSIESLESKQRIDCGASILKKDNEAFAIKVGNNFYKSNFPKGSMLVVAPNVSPTGDNFVLRIGEKGLVSGKKSTTRGKLVGTVVQGIMGE